MFVSPLAPTIGVLGSLAVMTLAKFTVERGRANTASQEKAATQRLMVQALLSLTEVRDAETGRHSRRTQQYARLLAEQLSAHPDFRVHLSAERIDLLASLAPLHDIGKVGIPDHVLNKPGPLTAGELAEMRKHPELGRDVIMKAEARVGVRDDATLAMAKDIVYTHHERWDGTGYPQGLRGTDIPVAGRVMALVDVYDAVRARSLYQRLPFTRGNGPADCEWPWRSFRSRGRGGISQRLRAIRACFGRGSHRLRVVAAPTDDGGLPLCPPGFRH